MAWISKEYNTQDRFGTWGVNVGLQNNIKNWVCDFYPYTFYFKKFNYIVGYFCLIELITIFVIISGTPNSPPLRCYCCLNPIKIIGIRV